MKNFVFVGKKNSGRTTLINTLIGTPQLSKLQPNRISASVRSGDHWFTNFAPLYEKLPNLHQPTLNTLFQHIAVHPEFDTLVSTHLVFVVKATPYEKRGISSEQWIDSFDVIALENLFEAFRANHMDLSRRVSLLINFLSDADMSSCRPQHIQELVDKLKSHRIDISADHVWCVKQDHGRPAPRKRFRQRRDETPQPLKATSIGGSWTDSLVRDAPALLTATNAAQRAAAELDGKSFDPHPSAPELAPTTAISTARSSSASFISAVRRHSALALQRMQTQVGSSSLDPRPPTPPPATSMAANRAQRLAAEMDGKSFEPHPTILPPTPTFSNTFSAHVSSSDRDRGGASSSSSNVAPSVGPVHLAENRVSQEPSWSTTHHVSVRAHPSASAQASAAVGDGLPPEVQSVQQEVNELREKLGKAKQMQQQRQEEHARLTGELRRSEIAMKRAKVRMESCRSHLDLLLPELQSLKDKHEQRI